MMEILKIVMDDHLSVFPKTAGNENKAQVEEQTSAKKHEEMARTKEISNETIRTSILVTAATISAL